jgi:hypothetical protein
MSISKTFDVFDAFAGGSSEFAFAIVVIVDPPV